MTGYVYYQLSRKNIYEAILTAYLRCTDMYTYTKHTSKYRQYNRMTHQNNNKND